ncbi:MAG TPA: glucosaminidase domain-containing protein [Flavobacterium sp.]|nr:glucosaminidase domain-containing protein [Flavobacterium sp.]
MRRIFILFLFVAFYSCGSSSKVRTTTTTRTNKTRTATVKKPAVNVNQGSKSTQGENKSEVLEATSKISVTPELVREYIEQYKEIAKENMRKHGIPASITLAQGVLESGAGTGVLARKANNHFGIKCHTGWTGESVHHDDDAAQECFRKYDQSAESYRDHSLFLTTRSRYANLFRLDKGDYVEWAKGLRAAGYATDVKYPEKLIGLIERYELYKVDEEVLGSGYTPVARTPEIKLDDKSYRVSQGDTLYSISKKFNITVDELMNMNKLSDNALSIGQILKIKS